jgi:hypothetical protein
MTAYIVFVTAVPPTGTVMPDPTPVWAVIKEASSADEAVSAVVALGSLPSNNELHASDLSTESTEHFVVTHDVTVNPKPPSAERRIDSVNPNTGPEAGGTEITLTGGGFTNIGGVRFEGPSGTQWAYSFEVIDDQTMTCPTPPGTGTVNVIAFNGDPGDATLEGGFTYS